MRRSLAALVLLATTAVRLSGQAASTPDDRPLSPRAKLAVLGEYGLTQPGRADTTRLRVFERDGQLFGQLRDNAPTRLLHQGGQRFIPAEAPDFRISFAPVTGRAVTVQVTGPDLVMRGRRVTAAADPSTTGALFDEMARADSLLFDAAYVTCNMSVVGAMLTPDVEFYHDKSGFHAGDVVRGDFERLTSNCPRSNGVRRVIVPGSLRVYPIKDYGVVQMGEHEFRKEGEVATAARFVHLWTKRSGRWQLSRVLSFDHLPMTGR